MKIYIATVGFKYEGNKNICVSTQKKDIVDAIKKRKKSIYPGDYHTAQVWEDGELIQEINVTD